MSYSSYRPELAHHSHPYGSDFAAILEDLEALGLPSTKQFDEQRRAPAPDELEHAPIRTITAAEKELEDAPYSQPIVQPELSATAQEATHNIKALLYPSDFSHHYSAVMTHSTHPVDTFTWELRTEDIYAKSVATNLIIREPNTERDTDLEELCEQRILGGSKSYSRNEYVLDIDPTQTARNLFTVAYFREHAMLAAQYTRQGSKTLPARLGMEIYNEGAVGARRLPAAEILQRGLLAYDAMLLTADAHPDQARALHENDANAIPDQDYLEFVMMLTATRPISIRHGANNTEKSPMYAGVDLTALRCMAYTETMRDFAAARDVVLSQTDASFGPEFLTMLEESYNAQPTEQAKSTLIKALVASMRDDVALSTGTYPARFSEVVVPQKVTHAEPAIHPDKDTSYTVPYARTAAKTEAYFSAANYPAHLHRLNSIASATQKARLFEQTIREVRAEYGLPQSAVGTVEVTPEDIVNMIGRTRMPRSFAVAYSENGTVETAYITLD